MPLWLQILIGVAAAITALGVIWTKLLKPGAKLVTLGEQVLPLLTEMSTIFKDNPHAFKVLNEIQAQFKTDSGSSLRDVVNRLEAAAKENRISAEELKVAVEAARRLAEQDRARFQEALVKLDSLTARVDASAATGARIERQATNVADDLAAAHKRADEHGNGEPGAAADASAQQTAKEKRREGA